MPEYEYICTCGSTEVTIDGYEKEGHRYPICVKCGSHLIGRREIEAES